MHYSIYIYIYIYISVDCTSWISSGAVVYISDTLPSKSPIIIIMNRLEFSLDSYKLNIIITKCKDIHWNLSDNLVIKPF